MEEVDRNQRDLLIRLDQKVSDLKLAVDSLANGVFSKIAMLEKDKADRTMVEELQDKVNKDIEIRVRSLEGKIVYLSALASIAGAGISLLIEWFLHKGG